ncbi:MAG TPA: hypothetical protein VIH90_04310 [Candidatus Saccharimonadales bacterium]
MKLDAGACFSEKFSQSTIPTLISVLERYDTKAYRNGLIVRAWGIKDIDDLSKVAISGCDGATVNWLDRAKEYLYMDRINK